ncbi:anaerobic ribonucleoside-triphosphate reductase, partial [Paracoccus denitrificans]|uniref:anaerobic ribonucleoside-triphosphate reductase n=1 Tax=Paracoccus denitrificans TaxID=266 RepID=UPI00353079B1
MKLFGVGMIRNFTDDAHDIAAEWGHAFALRLLDHARGRTTAFQEQTGHLYNLEATPAEGTTYRFAKEDRKRFPGILQAGTEHEPYYTNSSQLPVGFTGDPFEALERQEALQHKIYRRHGAASLHGHTAVLGRVLSQHRRAPEPTRSPAGLKVRPLPVGRHVAAKPVASKPAERWALAPRRSSGGTAPPDASALRGQHAAGDGSVQRLEGIEPDQLVKLGAGLHLGQHGGGGAVACQRRVKPLLRLVRDPQRR